MFDRRHNVLDEPEILEDNGRAVSQAEVAPCNCPDLCIRDHEND